MHQKAHFTKPPLAGESPFARTPFDECVVVRSRCHYTCRLDAREERVSHRINTNRLLYRKQLHADPEDVNRVASCIIWKVAGQVSPDLSLGF